MQKMKDIQDIQDMQDIQDIQDTTIIKETDIHEIVIIMTHFMNYLSVSLYEDQFTQNHQNSYSIIKSIYYTVSLNPDIPPSLYDVEQFYNNILYLANVTFTDDPDFYNYKIKLRKYIARLKCVNIKENN
jgi:hypothetical protein